MNAHRIRRTQVAAVVVALGLTVASPALADDKPKPGYRASEIVPTGVEPPPARSGFAGDRSRFPTVQSESSTFGRIAGRAGVGLRTYRYSELHGNASTLDVYTPRKFRGRHGRQVRTVVLVHGGAWQIGDRIDLERKAVQLTKLGFVVVSVNYRLATEGPWPAQRDDVNAAIRYVRKNAKQLNVDNKRTVILGSSAGGQIAAAVATQGSGKKRFRGLVTLSGLLNPRLMAQQDPSFSNAVIPELLLRCLPVKCPALYNSATAARSLDRKDPPSLLFHSAKETPWNPRQSREFARASRAVGVPSTLVILPIRQHGIDAWARLWPTLKPWLLDRLGRENRPRR